MVRLTYLLIAFFAILTGQHQVNAMGPFPPRNSTFTLRKAHLCTGICSYSFYFDERSFPTLTVGPCDFTSDFDDVVLFLSAVKSAVDVTLKCKLCDTPLENVKRMGIKGVEGPGEAYTETFQGPVRVEKD